ncbi:MAG: hypothetical protein HYZ37_10145 [Candidatus Solibacter usitatus]|nr:hypothetical protein [Candidatus Solibacter usitatus]
MALWTDRNFPQIEDLERVDSEVVSVASAAQIDLNGKIAEAQDTIDDWLSLYLQRSAMGAPAKPGDVVITSPLRRLAVASALSMVFRDAHFRQMADRFKEKWKEYERLAMCAQRDLAAAGVGRVSKPLRRPSSPMVIAGSGSLSTGTYYVCTSIVDGRGGESEAGEPAVVTTQTLATLTVSLGIVASGATGWNVFMGRTFESMTQQNALPIPVESTFSSGSSLLDNGRAPEAGQSADHYTQAVNRIIRG